MIDLGNLDDCRLGLVGDPGLVLQLVLELALGPARITDEGADLESLHLVHDGLGGGEMGRVLEPSVGLGPAEGGKGEVLGADGSADEHGNFGEGPALFLWQDVGTEELPHLLAEGPVENVTERAGVAAVFGEEEHAPEKGGFAQTRIGENEVPLERGLRWNPG